MFISLQQLEHRPVRFNLDVPAGEIKYDSDLSQTSDLHAEGTATLLSHSMGEIRVQGNLSVNIQGSCDRCVESFTFPVKNEFDLVYLPTAEAMSGEKEVDQTGIEVGYYEGGGLELNEVLREVVLLAVPMQVVCKETCKGICPDCGQNRNQVACDCHAKAVDDRWSKLREIRAESGSRN